MVWAIGGACPPALHAQTERGPYNITVQAPYSEGDTIYLRSQETGATLDSCICRAGLLHFKGAARLPQLAALHVAGAGGLRIAESDIAVDDERTLFVLDERGFRLLQGSDENRALRDRAQMEEVLQRRLPPADPAHHTPDPATHTPAEQRAAAVRDSFATVHPNHLATLLTLAEHPESFTPERAETVLQAYTAHPDNPLYRRLTRAQEQRRQAPGTEGHRPAERTRATRH